MINTLAYLYMQTMDAEAAHHLAFRQMEKKKFAPGVMTSDKLKTELFGVTLKNPLGLAAGFDKNALLVDVIEDYGFGYLEVGSVTFRGGPGNPKPRMFRLNKTDIMNRMGLNGEAAPVVAERLKTVQSTAYAVNIAKTHSPEILGDKAIEDMIGSLQLLAEFGIYTALNVSCPNTEEGKTFEVPEALQELLSACQPYRKKPLLVKLSPNDNMAELDQILEVCENAKIDGYLCCNTLPYVDPKHGKGGRSGTLLQPYALAMTQHITQHTGKPVIALGGIYDKSQYQKLMNNGATACQAYNGYVRGPHAGLHFPRRVLT